MTQPKCLLTTYVDPGCLERIDAEAARQGITRTKLTREVLLKAFPEPPPRARKPRKGVVGGSTT